MSIRFLAGKGARPFVSAHRGFSARAPENTMPALTASFEAGADVAEIDVRLTSDGTLVLMHDATVDRTTDGKGPISEMTMEQVRNLDAGRWFDRKFAGTPVPTLDEVLAWARGRMALLIELKNYPERNEAFVDDLVATILRNDAEDFAVPACFDHPTLAEIHLRHQGWSLEMILPCRLVDPVHAARAAGATLLSLEPEFIVASDLEVVHAAGLSVLTTMKSTEHGRELYNMGVDFIESDDVDLVCQTLRQLDGWE
jgi:glycerophosphoryl diester phosphodiesterase